MAHALTIRENGFVEHAFTGEVGWHGLGNKLEAGASIEAWQEAAGMDWAINRAPVQYMTADGAVTVEDKHVLFRSDNKAALGIVSDNYKVVQPGETLEFFRDIADGFSLETAGTLFGGRRFWALARVMGDTRVLDENDRVGGFLLLSSSADGTMATEARFTTVRVVCNNTLSLARGAGKAEFKAKHKSVFCPDTAKRTLGISRTDIENTFESAMEDFRRMARQRITKNDMVKMTLELFGYDTENMSDKEYQDAVRKPLVSNVGTLAVTGRDLIGSEMMGGNGTTWAWLNAVTQYVDHMARAKTESHRLDNSWFGRGDTLKTKAREIAMVQIGTAPQVTYEASPDDDMGLLGDVLAATAAQS